MQESIGKRGVSEVRSSIKTNDNITAGRINKLRRWESGPDSVPFAVEMCIIIRLIGLITIYNISGALDYSSVIGNT